MATQEHLGVRACWAIGQVALSGLVVYGLEQGSDAISGTIIVPDYLKIPVAAAIGGGAYALTRLRH